VEKVFGRTNAERESRRIQDGVSSLWGPLLPYGKDTRPLPPALEPWTGFALIVAAHNVERRYVREARAVGISLRDFVLLAEIARRPGLSQGALARGVGLTRSRISEQLTVLDTAGYVSREINPRDLRRRQIFMTMHGQHVYEELAHRLARDDRSWLMRVPSPVRSLFSTCVKRLAPQTTPPAI
jgi:DNA-binding MarR family transcriptional regulator